MAIWIWIGLACIFSKLALGKRQIGLEHYVWLLFPIDMYGINVAGVTIKPYMLFCVFLFLRQIARGRTIIRVIRGWTLPSLAMMMLIFILNMFNSASLHSLSVPCMLMVVWFCMTIYTSSWNKTAHNDIQEAIIATGIGYGLVFVIGFLLLMVGMNVSGIGASTRMQPGFFLQFSNMFHGTLIETRRLRGFTIDPNTVLGTFVFSGAVSLIKILSGKNKRREWLCLGLSAICVLLSNSRTGLICFVLALIMSVFGAYRNGTMRTKNLIKGLALLSIFSVSIVLITTDWIENFVDLIVGLYSNRSSLNDQFGRFTIWKEAFGILMENNPLFGIGMGQMQFYTSAKRACHNTWLDCLCGNGIVLGSVFVLFILMTLVRGMKDLIRNVQSDSNQLQWSLVISITAVIISLITVDNSTYSYLWFGLSTLMMTSSIS